jgi:hypothetical protein
MLDSIRFKPCISSHIGGQVLNDRRRAAADLLQQGKTPSEISQITRRPLGVVLNQLFHQVGIGRIRRSDILFSIPSHLRRTIEEAIARVRETAAPKIRRELARMGVQIPRGDLSVYLQLRDSRADLGDMYEFVREIELQLHDFVREALVAEHGEENWWRNGVPLNIREDCAVLNERDPEPVSGLFCYTTVMHLRQIFDKEWNTLSRSLPPAVRSDKQDFLSSLSRLNKIRNIVMHPVKGILLQQDDFDFVRHLRKQVSGLRHNLRNKKEAA